MIIKQIIPPDKLPTFDDCRTGQVFEINGSYYLRIRPLDSGHNSINVVSGEPAYTNNNAKVKIFPKAVLDLEGINHES